MIEQSGNRLDRARRLIRQHRTLANGAGVNEELGHTGYVSSQNSSQPSSMSLLQVGHVFTRRKAEPRLGRPTDIPR